MRDTGRTGSEEKMPRDRDDVRGGRRRCASGGTGGWFGVVALACPTTMLEAVKSKVL